MDKSQIQVLLIEDNLADAVLLREALAEDALAAFELTVAERLNTAVDILQERSFDMILLDLGLPDSQGWSTFIRIQELAPQIPKVILSGLADETLASQAVHAGAQDYLVKGTEGFSSAARAIRYAIERQRAQEALRASEARYHQVLDSMMEGCQIIDFEWRYIYLNDIAATQSRYPREALLNHTMMEMYPGIENTGLFDAMRLCMQERVPARMENQFTFPDGSLGWFELSIQPALQGIFILSADITERKLAESTVQASERRFRAMIENGLDDISLLDASGNLIWESPAVVRNLGYEPNAFLGQNIFDLVHPEDRGWTSELYVQLLSEPGGRQFGSFRLLHADGSWRHVEAIVTNLLDDPSVRAMVVNYRDVTERHSAIAQLYDSEQRYRALFENSPVSIWEEDFSEVKRYIDSLKQAGITDLRAYCSAHPEVLYHCSSLIRVLDVNNAALKLYKTDNKAELIESAMQSLSQGEAANNLADFVAIAEGRMSNSWEGADETLTGEPLEISLNWSVAPGYEQDYSKIIVTVIDITESKRAELGVLSAKQFLQGVQNALSAHIAILNSDGQIVHVNSAWCAFADQNGLQSVDYGIGLNYLQLCDAVTGVAADEARLVADTIREVLTGRRAEAHIEYACHSPERQRWFVLRITRFDDGAQRWVVLAHENTTNLKLAELAMQSAQSRLQHLVTASPSVIYSTKPSGDFAATYISENVQALTGYAPHQFTDDPAFWLGHMHPEDAPRILEELASIKDGEVLSQEYRFRFSDGIYHWTHDDLQMVLDDSGKRLETVGSWTDITERKQVELKNRENTEDLALINTLNEAANRGETLPTLVKLLGHEFKQLFFAKGTGLYLLSDDGKTLHMSGFSLPEPVVGRLERLIGRQVPPLVIPVLPGGMFQKFLQAERGTIVNTPQEIQRWIAEFAGAETVPSALRGTIFGLLPKIFRLLGIRSTISLPLNSSGRVIGLLSVSSGNLMGARELERLHKIGTQLTSAILRKQDEQRLRESTERFEQLANNIEETFWIASAQAKDSIYLSPAAEKIWGRPLEALRKPKAFLTQILLEDRARVEASLVHQGQGEKTEIEYRIQRPDGSISWIWDRSFPILDSDGRLLSNAGLSTDITEIKAAQSELELLNRTLETRVQDRTAEVLDLYDKAPCGYHSLDENGNFVNINQTELDWLGYRREELIGIKSFADLLTVESQAVFAGTFPRFKEQGAIKDLEFDMICKKGEILPVLLNATATYDAEGRYLQSRSTMFDITERRKVELALLRSRDDLSAANVALERAARLKDEFMANMSHELRTPLNAILGLSESLNEQVAGPLNAKQKKYIQTINDSGRHLLQLINDILDLAKIEAGQIVLNLGQADLRMVCEASLLLVKQLAHRKNQHIEFEMDEGIQYILADERSLKQMLVNLLSNAIKFTPEGEKLGLAAKLDREEKKVHITVWDHGIGIAEKDLARLFKPFVQLDAGLTRETSGTGLGLALVASMARLHGGGVGVESDPGHGSRFTIMLPWEPVIETDLSSRLKITTKFRALDPNAPRPTILLIEDTDTVVMLVRDFLEVAGYNVEVARNGYDGIVLAEKIHPALILMDIQMPGMDGLEITRRIRENPEIKHTPIIALTALAMAGDRERCLAAGMDEYISKPINLNSFTKTIARLLQAQEERKPA